MSARSAEPKGVILRLIGVALIFTGGLDSLLSWRGGIALSDFYVVLIACGSVLYAAGQVRRQWGREARAGGTPASVTPPVRP